MNENTSVDGHAADIIKDLAQEAVGAEIQHIAVTGLGPGLPSSVPVAYDHDQHRFVSVKSLIEEYRDAPQRRTGTARVDTLQSFKELVNRQKDADSVLLGKTSWPDPALTAVLDYHKADGGARLGRHRIVYAFPITDELKAWVGANGVAMEQAKFAAFLEEHAAELSAPSEAERIEFERLFRERFATPSEVIELSRHLEVFVASKAKQGVRLQTGERVLEFAEEHQNAKGEKIAIPGIFMVSVRAFVDGDPVRIPARLRYRLHAGEVVWFYQLYRWEAFLRDQVGYDLKDAAKATELPAFEGTPES